MSDDEIVEYMRELEKPFVTSSEIAEEAGIARQNAYRKLKRLHENGRIEKSKPAPNTAIWWLPD